MSRGRLTLENALDIQSLPAVKSRSALPKMNSKPVQQKTSSKNNISSIYAQKKSTQNHSNRTRRLKQLLALSFILVITISLFSGLVFLKHRQMCQYQSLVDSGKLITDFDGSLCKDPLNVNNWLDMVSAVFDINLEGKFIVNASYDPSKFKPIDDCIDITNPICWLRQLEGNTKNTNGITNILLVGTDKRESDTTLGNTDTIMLVSLNNNTGDILLISFPRDLLLNIVNPDGVNEFIKINSIYNWYGERGKEALFSAIKQTTGLDVHYYALFSFDTFTRIIDEIGDIDINLENNFEDAFPSDEVLLAGRECEPAVGLPDFCIFRFPAGPNTFDSFDALVYSRARYLSSDYSRSSRQQEIVKAIISSAIREETSLKEKFDTITGLYNVLSETVETNIGLGDLTGLFKFYEKLNGDIATLVLDPTIAGGNIIYEAGVIDGFGYSDKFYDYTYSDLQNYIANTWRFISYFEERPKVLVVNASGIDVASESPIGRFINLYNPYWELYYENNPFIDLQGIRIYDFTNGEKINSLRDIKSAIPNSFLYNAVIDSIDRSLYQEDFLILIGK